MRRLYLKIYLAFVAIVGMLALIAGFAIANFRLDRNERASLDGIAELVAGELPASLSDSESAAALEKWGARLRLDLAFYGGDGRHIAAYGADLPRPPENGTASGIVRRRRESPALALHLPDGRWLIVRDVGRQGRGSRGLVWILGIAVAIGIAAYPVARGITRRLEQLKGGVDALAAGDLAARVEVKGRDEVASLAQSFNRASERIEALVNSQRTALASASHELRSPLARMRVAVELLGDARPELRDRVVDDIQELDGLIDELLVASRVDAVPLRREPVDLLGLAAEVSAAHGAEVSGEPVEVLGDARLLRRLMRNLLENAARYGGGSAIEVQVTAETGLAVLEVCDRGPGIPEHERERIFEPFYRPAGLAESEHGGVGLGLALVRQIAAQHGGSALCRPRADGGTIFEVRLPTA